MKALGYFLYYGGIALALAYLVCCLIVIHAYWGIVGVILGLLLSVGLPFVILIETALHGDWLTFCAAIILGIFISLVVAIGNAITRRTA